MRTLAELSADVLQRLRITGAGETASAEDTTLVESTYTSKFAEWRRRGLVWWTYTDRSTEEIPDDVFSVLVDLIENEVAGSFGKGEGGYAKREQERMLLRDLRQLNIKPASGEPTSFVTY